MARIPVSMKAALDVYLRKQKFFTQYCSIYTFTAAKKDVDVSIVGARNFFWVHRIFCPYFPKFVRKTLPTNAL